MRNCLLNIISKLKYTNYMLLSLNFFQKKYTLGGFNISTQTGIVKKEELLINIL